MRPAGPSRLPWLAYDLVIRHGGRWQISEHPDLAFWSAERREGTAIRFVAAHTPGELAAKLEAAEGIRP